MVKLKVYVPILCIIQNEMPQLLFFIFQNYFPAINVL